MALIFWYECRTSKSNHKSNANYGWRKKQYGSKKEFIEAVYQRGKEDEQKTGIPPALMAAQAGWESNYGSSYYAIHNNNIFGLVTSPFGSVDECIIFYENLLSNPNGSYAYLHDLPLEGWVNEIGKVYCPDNPNYGN